MYNHTIQVSAMGQHHAIQASTTENPAVWLTHALGGPTSDAGVKVNASTAMTHAALWQGINIIASDVGLLPLVLMRQLGDKFEEERNHPGARVMVEQPNETMSSTDFRELMISRAVLHGNACAAILRNDLTREPVELLPLPPESTAPEYGDDGRLFIVSRVESSSGDTSEWVIPYQDVLHIRGLSTATDGLWGLSLFDIARNTIGHGIALTKHGAKSFANGGRLNGVITMDSVFRDPDQKRAFRRDWEHLHSGADNAGRIAILENGMRFEPMSMNHQDSQWLEAKKFDRDEIAGLLGIPPHKLGNTQTPFSNIAEQSQNYMQSCLQRWLNKWVTECKRKLLRPKERESGSHFFKFKTAAFLRGDTLARATSYEKFISMRVYSPNEVRKMEDLNPYEGGDRFENPPTTAGGNDLEPEDPAGTEMMGKLLRNAVGRLLKIEGKEVRSAARGDGNFCDWLDSFYGSTLPARLTDLLGIDTVAQYCEGRKQQLLSLADGDAQTFINRIEDDFLNVAERTRQLTDHELGVEK